MKLVSSSFFGLLILQSNAFAQTSTLKVGDVFRPAGLACVDNHHNLVETDAKLRLEYGTSIDSLTILSVGTNSTRVEVRGEVHDETQVDGSFVTVLDLSKSHGLPSSKIVSSTTSEPGSLVGTFIKDMSHHALPSDLKLVDGTLVSIPNAISQCNSYAKVIARDVNDFSPIEWCSKVPLSAEEVDAISTEFLKTYSGTFVRVEPAHTDILLRKL